jgi:DUF3050 family protein
MNYPLSVPAGGNVHSTRHSPSMPSMAHLEALRAAVAPAREALLAHPIYDAVDTLVRLRRFMASHVYAVWDFMCLAKRLQRDLTSLQPLWRPPARPSLARFINGLVLGEESDVDPDGQAASHLELYISAMDEVGASTSPARAFLARLEQGEAVALSLAAAEAPPEARAFVMHTLETVERGTTVEVLAVFLFGREDLIPDMFSRLLPRWAESRSARRFAYYVARHIEVDGDDHGPAAQRALAELAEDDAEAWGAARRAAHAAIAARIALWDGVHANLGT